VIQSIRGLPGHSKDDRIIADGCDEKRVPLRDIGDVIIKGYLMGSMGKNTAIGKGNSCRWAPDCFER
jgi:hypothetical protein